MLELRPNCEYCDKDLPADSPEARICSYECTSCATCAETVLDNVCPNCGGGFVPRPIRPSTEQRPGAGLNHDPASTRRVHPIPTLADSTSSRGWEMMLISPGDSGHTAPPEPLQAPLTFSDSHIFISDW